MSTYYGCFTFLMKIPKVQKLTCQWLGIFECTIPDENTKFIYNIVLKLLYSEVCICCKFISNTDVETFVHFIN